MKRLIIPFCVFVLLVISFLIIYNQSGFTGERIKNPDSYQANIKMMNGTDEHKISLKEDDVLDVEFETEKGSLYLELIAPNGETIYSGNGKGISKFEINIDVTGNYVITIKAKYAKGKINIKIKEN